MSCLPLWRSGKRTSADLDRRFVSYLRTYMRQHNLTFVELSKKVGISDASIHRCHFR